MGKRIFEAVIVSVVATIIVATLQNVINKRRDDNE